MKICLIILLFSISAFAKKDFIKISEMYCEQKVQPACEVVKCHKDPKSCEGQKPTKAQSDQMLAEVESMKKNCADKDFECLIHGVQQKAEDPLIELEKECQKGDRESCYAKEYLEFILGVQGLDSYEKPQQ